ncbi:hypothetical protein HK099_005784 [Clydaea vesicula]|uniref:MYND-type domain-containing protein n=1 Tax=Clydaea vesicula TaxID=447962 RepID=A0AAD5TYB6_9FUNG|nr:hypothetical protein HK099_005784 [Clydaea vesicula]
MNLLSGAKQAAMVISLNQYDKRALTCTDLLPLTNSLHNLCYMISASTLRISYILATDGGLELIIQIMNKLTSRDTLPRLAYSAALSCLTNVAVRGNQRLRRRLVEAGVIKVIVDLLQKVVEVLKVVKATNNSFSDEPMHPQHVQQQALFMHLQNQTTLNTQMQSPFIIDTNEDLNGVLNDNNETANSNPVQNLLNNNNFIATAAESDAMNSGSTLVENANSYSIFTSTNNANNGSSSPTQAQQREILTANDRRQILDSNQNIPSTSDSDNESLNTRSSNLFSSGQNEQESASRFTFNNINNDNNIPLQRPLHSRADFLNRTLGTANFETRDSEVDFATTEQENFNFASHATIDVAIEVGNDVRSGEPMEQSSDVQSNSVDNNMNDVRSGGDSGSSESTSDSHFHEILYRVEDILQAIKIIAYLSKYPTIRQDLHAYSGKNVFELVEIFTGPSNLVEIRKWATVCMRNAFKRDTTTASSNTNFGTFGSAMSNYSSSIMNADILDSTDSSSSCGTNLRRCGFLKCGKVEKTPRQFSKCSRCRRITYCCKLCQRNAWPLHKHWCLKYEAHGNEQQLQNELPQNNENLQEQQEEKDVNLDDEGDSTTAENVSDEVIMGEIAALNDDVLMTLD